MLLMLLAFCCLFEHMALLAPPVRSCVSVAVTKTGSFHCEHDVCGCNLCSRTLSLENVHILVLQWTRLVAEVPSTSTAVGMSSG